MEEMGRGPGLPRYETIKRELVLLARQDPDAAARIVRALEDASPHVIDNLLDVLAQTGSPVVGPAIVDRLSSPTPFVRTKAAGILAVLPDPIALPALARNLAGASTATAERLATLEALRGLGSPEAGEVVARYAATAEDETSLLRALHVLGDLPGEASEKALRGWLTSEEATLRLAAARSLLILGKEEGADVVKKALTSESAEIQQGALQIIQELRLSELLPDLRPLLVSENPQLRFLAVATITELEGESVEELLLARVEDTDGMVRRAALFSLAERGHEPTLEKLRRLAREQGDDGRWALMVLGRIRDSASITEMVGRIRTTSDIEEKTALVRSLARTRDAVGIPILLEVVGGAGSSDLGARTLARDAARYLANFRETALEPVRRAILETDDFEIRRVLLSNAFDYRGSREAIDVLRSLRQELDDPALQSIIEERIFALEPSVRDVPAPSSGKGDPAPKKSP